MRMLSIHIIPVTALLLMAQGVIAQRKKAPVAGDSHLPPVALKASIRVSARAYRDSVVLRWAPTADWAWSSLNYNGYIVERLDLSVPGHPQKEILTATPLKPMPLARMKTAFGRDDRYAAIAAQCLYGKNFTVSLRKGQGGRQDQSDVWNMRYVYALQVADYDGKVAEAEALRLTDAKVQPGGVYIYRVYPAHPPSQGKVDTGNVMIRNDGSPRPSKPRLQEMINGDHVAELHWQRAQPMAYSGYYIERSQDGRVFTSLTRIPYFSSRPDPAMGRKDSLHARLYALLVSSHVFIDSLPQNYHRYFYRIRGVDAFAEMSEYSDTLSVMGRDLTPPTLVIPENPKYAGGRKIWLHWKKPIRERDFAGYYITRAHSAGGPYLSLTTGMLDPGATSFEDTAAFAHGQNYYIVATVDTAGNLGPSIPMMGIVPDHTPPAVPQGLKGHIDRNGLVHLSWKKNGEEDVKGYKVYFANGRDHVFSQVTLTPQSDTAFTDSITLKTLTKDIWYKVVAVDESNNHSAYSEAVKLRKPDIVPPVPPLALKVLVDTGGVQIDWIQSSSEDAVGYIIFRKEKGTGWAPLARVRHDSSRTIFRFTDRTLQPFHEYSYAAEAVDEDSLHSVRSKEVTAVVKTVPDLPPLKTLTAAWDEKAKQVHLRWQFRDKGRYFFVLYRGTNAEKLTRYRSEGADSDQFTDNALDGLTGRMQYAIQVIYQDRRGRTRISDPVTVSLSAP